MNDDFDQTMLDKSIRYIYAIINANGFCWLVTDSGTKKVQGLPWILRQGWRPVRETPFTPATGTEYILICLERA